MPIPQHILDIVRPVQFVEHLDDYEPEEKPCIAEGGHVFECTGTSYGGDDERWHGEGRCLCIHCGADGDA